MQNKSVVNDDRSKGFLSLAVIKSLSIFSNLIQKSLPFIDIITQSFIDLFRVNNPQWLVVEPVFNVVFCASENSEELFVGLL